MCTTDCMTSSPDCEQIDGYDDWTWQCGQCGYRNTLTRATILRKYRQWEFQREFDNI